ncbi:HEAT repeat-containing protein 4-like isoform X2 [Anneissia japonica]|uniref:HEAT repeat-containing protein 4-like isoform X2 n=1 Tax=Anneissia japonica TaxID=1529436 RepID=UPI00142597C8|nr:HEAT repeat-containing protein 4-like isoform X2 [Anneissia japonica]
MNRPGPTHDKLIHPQLFACANRVKIPQVGDDGRNFKTFYLEQTIPRQFLQPVETYNKKYIKKISADLLFSEDVVRCHASHTLPYDKDDMWKSFDPSNIVQREPVKVSGVMGRYNHRGSEKKHLPCHIKTVSKHRLKPLKKKAKLPKPADNQEIKDDEGKKGVDGPQDANVSQKLRAATFLTQNDGDDIEEADAENQQNKSDRKSTTKWDEHLLVSLSKNTARWIVNERLNEGPQQDKLKRLLNDLYGESGHTVDTLIRDDASMSDLASSEGTDLPSRHLRRKPSQHASSTVSPQAKDSTKKNDDEDDINSHSLASFYRLPGGVRRVQRHLQKELAGAINTTARDICVPQKKPKPPPTLKDVMNDGVGNKMYETDNQFEQEWLSGAQLVPRKDSSILTFDTGNKYRMVKQENYPADPKHWHSSDKTKKAKEGNKAGKEKLPHKGYRKWSNLPQPVENEASLSIHEAGYDAEAHREPDPITMKQHRSNVTLIRVVDEWRNKWHLGNKWYDSSIDELERDMSDINEHVRLQAIATIARAATYRPAANPGVPLKSQIMKWRGTTTSMMIGLAGTFKKTGSEDGNKPGSAEGVLPDKLYNCVLKALNDSSVRVRVTAAMALYTLNRPNEEARKTLHDIIRVGSPPERWAAAQCLAHSGVCDSFVVGELVKQFFDSSEHVKLEQCVNLLSKLSENSTLVHSMIAEQLNSTSWQHRMMACKILPKLHGLVNKDIMHKLANLMWHDWHHQVRRVAAQTLGKTGHGKEVHNDLHDRILTGTERDKVDALHKIAHLGIMTARLLPAYLQCFDDSYISVRLSAAKTAGILVINDEKVLRKLLFMTQFDTNWKVKAHAIQALGLIGKVTTPIRDAIIWALRFETEAGVRAEACSAVISLKITGNDISYILQDKLLVEPDQLVRSQIILALESMGVSSQGDMDMVQQIKEEVRRLCTRYNIASKIAQNEKQEDADLYIDKYFNVPQSPEPYFEDDDMVTSEKTKAAASISRPSTRHSVRTTTPSIVVSLDDDFKNGSPDMSLFRNHENTGGLSVSPTGSWESSPQDRRTPEEKLEKLIDLYEGTCTLDEYKEFAHPKETADRTDDGRVSRINVEVLPMIPESEAEEKNTQREDGNKPGEDDPMDEEVALRNESGTSNSTIGQSVSVADPLESRSGQTEYSLSRNELRTEDVEEGGIRPSTVRSDLTSNVESVDIEQFEEAIEAIKGAQCAEEEMNERIVDTGDNYLRSVSPVESKELSEADNSQYDSESSDD